MQVRISAILASVLICTGAVGQTPVDGTALAQRVPTTFGSSGRKVTYVVLGDSTAAGIGGTYRSGSHICNRSEVKIERASLAAEHSVDLFRAPGSQAT